MKSILSFILIAVSLTLTAQKFYDVMPTKDGVIYYSGVISADSTSAQVLYTRAHKWFISSYGSAQEVIQLADDDTIIGKGFFTLLLGGAMTSVEMEVWHIVTIRVKDGRWRYEISDFRTGDSSMELWAEAVNKYMPRKVTDFVRRADDHIINLITSLSIAMSEPEPDEW